jgi:uncharacterized protein YbjT (DUF2867 family)
MNGKTALLAGATGLVGSQLLPLLLASGRYSKVTVLARSKPSITHAKLESKIVDFDKLDSLGSVLACDDVYCCLGTTMKEAGSRDAFRKVDYEYPVALARATRKLGASQYSLVSAVGANRNSRFFYNRVKGDVEDAISAIDFDSVHIYRPSLLIGPRKRQRAGELIGAAFGRLFSFLMRSRYKPIKSIKVARAMIAYASRDEGGIYFHPSDTIQSFR